MRAFIIVLSALVGVGAAASVVVSILVAGYLADAPQMPSRDVLWTLRRAPGMTFLDRNGKVLATRGAKYAQPVKLAELPAYVPKAFLAAEDKRFYQHGPVDLHAIARALEANIRAKRSAEGASTLTQQLARTLFLKRDPSLKRKVQEAYLAWRMEQAMSKDEILELYMNRTYFGDGAYGLDAASEAYFDKPASKLTVIEAATLAGLPNAPSRLALTNDMAGAVARAHHILGTMREEGWVTDADFATAMATTPVLVQTHTSEGDEAYVLDAAATQAQQLAGGAVHDLVIRTTIDPTLQTTATNVLRDVVGKEGAHRNVTQGAVVTLAPDGAILAMVGGLNHDQSSFNRVTQAKRQPGSSFKAFVYGAAVERGATAQEVRVDGPISYDGWTPENYGKGYAGAVTLQQALARSLNTVSVRLTLEVGPSSVAEFARRMGLSDIPENPGPSIALGAYEVTPMEMAAGYQVFQTGGGRTTPYLISEIRSTRGDLIYSNPASAPVPVLDPLYATRLVGMLKGVITSGTGTGANIGRPAAGKTGTSQNWRDAWFVGFTPDFLTAVWVGNDNGHSMAKVTGGELPAEIWKKVMTVAEKGLPSRDFPWLTSEPATLTPPLLPVSDHTPYSDEPPDMEGDDDDSRSTTDTQPRVDTQADQDTGDDSDPRDAAEPNRHPYVQRYDDEDDSPRYADRRARQRPSLREEAPDDGDDDSPPPDPSRSRRPPPSDPYDDDSPRYRY